MTNKQAIRAAIKLIEKIPNNEELILKLKEMDASSPVTHWTQEIIFDTIDQFILDNGRLPKRKEFETNSTLPMPLLIRKHFNMPCGEFLNIYYKNHIPKPKCTVKKYGEHPAEYWLEKFRNDFINMNCPTAKEYNDNRSSDAPSVYCLKNIVGTDRWEEVLKQAGVQDEMKKTQRRPFEQTDFTITRNFANADAPMLKQINQQLDIQLSKLKNMYEDS